MTARLREQAACFASAMASDRVAYPWNQWHDIAATLGTPLRARDLAWKIYDSTPFYRFHEAWAEACARLRSTPKLPRARVI